MKVRLRIYDNPEFEMTITEQCEQIEKLVSIALYVLKKKKHTKLFYKQNTAG
jgi:hypothetical protein